MMLLKKWISAFRERVRAFLGIDMLPSRLELIEIRDQTAKNHREVIDALAKIAMIQKYPTLSSSPVDFTSPSLDWEMVQRLELQNMLSQPPKED